jgi:soluble lytic murein transglycosylase-like protein
LFVVSRPLWGLIASLLAALPLVAMSASLSPSREVDACLQQAANKHGVAYALLVSIAEQESGFNPQAVRKPMTAGNSDGSVDYGLMQINSSWLPTLRQYGVTASQLFQPCVNADIGAWILANNFKRLGVTWNAVGAYNAQTQWKRVRYATGVYQKLQRRFGVSGVAHAQPMRTVSHTQGAATEVVTASNMNVWEGNYE